MAKNGLAKIGLAQIGQIRMAKTGLAKVGPFLPVLELSNHQGQTQSTCEQHVHSARFSKWSSSLNFLEIHRVAVQIDHGTDLFEQRHWCQRRDSRTVDNGILHCTVARDDMWFESKLVEETSSAFRNGRTSMTPLCAAVSASDSPGSTSIPEKVAASSPLHRELINWSMLFVSKNHSCPLRSSLHSSPSGSSSTCSLPSDSHATHHQICSCSKHLSG